MPPGSVLTRTLADEGDYVLNATVAPSGSSELTHSLLIRE
jgi:hypothetical protein